LTTFGGWAYSAAQTRTCPYVLGSESEIVMTSLTHLSDIRTDPIGKLKKSRPSGRLLRRTRLLLFLAIVVGSSLVGSSVPQSAHLVHYHSPPIYAAAGDFGVFSADEHSVSALITATTQAPSCRGRCLDPHPGQFRQWSGQQNGCWVQVWRGWPEGCQHYQWYNSCNGYWDSYPNGAPKVYWSCCVH